MHLTKPGSREVLFMLLFFAIFLRVTVNDVLTMQRNLGNLKGEDIRLFFSLEFSVEILKNWKSIERLL